MVAAVQAIGPPAVPFLVKAITRESFGLKGFYRDSWIRLPLWAQRRLPPPKPGQVDRWRAIRALRSMGPAAEPAVPDLIRTVRRTFGRNVSVTPSGKVSYPANFIPMGDILRRELVATLLCIGGTNRELVPTLLEAAPQEPDWFLSEWMDTLGNSNLTAAPQGSVGLLVTEASHSTNAAPRRGAAIRLLGLAASEKEEVFPILIEGLAQGGYVTSAAKKALQDISKRNTNVILVMAAALSREDPYLRAQIAEVLGNIGPPASPALPALEHVRNERDKVARYRIAEALWKIDKKGDRILPLKLEELKSSDDSTRWSAAVFLGSMREKAKPAVPALIERLQKDSSNRVRGRAAMSLGEIGPEAQDAVPALTQAWLQDEYSNVREAAESALKKIEPFTWLFKPAN
jgi:HEAT repeat protein